MQFKFGTIGDVEIVLVREDEKSIIIENKLFSYLKENELFNGKSGELYFNFSLNEKSVLFLGLGLTKRYYFKLFKSCFS